MSEARRRSTNGVPPCVLTIAGSDSGGGAGVQADARTIAALGGFGGMAITAITAQNTRGVAQWRPEPPAIIRAQVEAVLSDLPVRAIKTGLLPGAAAVRVIAQVLRRHAPIPLVIDPVLGSTSGTRFLAAAGVRALQKELLPLATIVTPNWPEAEILSGETVRNFAEAERVARALAAELHCAVLLKGGHAPGNVCRDVLATADGRTRHFESRRIATRNTHGTGCVLSAAMATELARGRGLVEVVAAAHRFLHQSLRAGRSTDWGGHGPAFF
jgi:hydroxymethylpyrimidine/phosphomethylpyrimidine kinase